MDDLDISMLIHQTRTVGFDPERPKIDVKKEWYKLGDLDPTVRLKSENEFIKDLVATVNTPGLTGYIIIGLEKNGTVTSSPFSQSGLRDQSELQGLVVKRVVEPVIYELEERIFDDSGVPIVLTILRIPPSISKPHVVKLYRTPSGTEVSHYIPIRKGTSINAASKYDIDFMYYDRKNFVPDYAKRLATFYFQSNLNIAILIATEISNKQITVLRFDTESWLAIGPLAFNAFSELANDMLLTYQNLKFGNSQLDHIDDLYSNPRYPKGFWDRDGISQSEIEDAPKQYVFEAMKKMGLFLNGLITQTNEFLRNLEKR